MDDRERAILFGGELAACIEGGDWRITPSLLPTVDRLIAAVRLDERRAVVAYLHHMAAQTSVALRPIQFLADAVERGMHLEERR